MEFSKKHLTVSDVNKFISENPHLSDKEIAKIVKCFNPMGIAHLRSCLIKETQTEWLNLQINGNHYDRIMDRIENRKKNEVEIKVKVIFKENNKFDLICDAVY